MVDERTSGRAEGASAWMTYATIGALAAVAFLLSAQLELFEAFIELSRDHEDWELDELATFVLTAGVAACVMMVHRGHVLSREIARRQAAERRAEHRALFDALTGLPNRQNFARALAERLEGGAGAGGYESIGVVVIDLDRFKPINDLHGHAVGDELLRAVGERLAAIEEVALAARFGGDEYALLIAPSEDAGPADRVARRAQAALARPFMLGSVSAEIGASLGVAIGAVGDTPEALLTQADQAMYRAKREGRGCIAYFDAALGESVAARAALEADLRRALRDGEIEPYFQPLVEIASGRLIGFEALARWRHPTKGVIAPNAFIPVAEDIGAVGELGLVILRKAATAVLGWREDLIVAVNLSPTQFSDPGLARAILATLAEVGLPPARLEVEITETAIIRDSVAARETVLALKAAGVRVALDDFGAGYSSLSNLRALPFDRVKIDRAFITSAHDEPEKARMARGILTFVESLGLASTAEGVETARDLEWLGAESCTVAQGFLFARPVSAEEVGWMLETRWAEDCPVGAAPAVQEGAAAA